MKNILVTGGAGFIGSHVVIELVESGYNPIIVDNFSNSDKKVLDGLRRITGRDIKCYEQDYQTAMDIIIAREQVDAVIHFAAFKSPPESLEKPIDYYMNNVCGLVSLLGELKKHKIPKLIFSSSAVVYGQADKVPLTELSPLKPAISPYGATKQMGEAIIKNVVEVSDNQCAIALRYFNPIGAHPSGLIGELPLGEPANLVPFMLQASMKGEPLNVYGNDYATRDGTCIRDFIHVVDLAQAHVKALEYLDSHSAGYYDVFNVGTGKGTSILEIVKAFQKATKQKLKYKIGPRRSGDIIISYASTKKIEEKIGWKAKKSLVDGLEDAWRWQQALTKNSAANKS